MTDSRLIAENSAGIQAQLHLDYLKPLFEQIRNDLLAQWRDSKHHEAAKRENLWREISCLNAVEAKVTRIIQTGTLAKAAIEREHKRH